MSTVCMLHVCMLTATLMFRAVSAALVCQTPLPQLKGCFGLCNIQEVQHNLVSAGQPTGQEYL